MACFVAMLNIKGAPVDRRLMRTMMHVEPYCQPRDERTWTDGAVGLGATPLDTPHLVEPAQPLGHHGQLCAAIDGRLDDRATLVGELEEKTGRSLRSVSDVELVLAAYERWGSDCASHLLGDFSFCVWDGERRRLFCARDHLGVKPLYWARVGDALIVSNVLRAIRRHPQISTRLDDHAIGDVLLIGACMDQSRTSFADIARLPPAHTLTCAGPDWLPGTTRYWSLQPGGELRLGNASDYVDHYVSTLEAVVSDRLRGSPAGVLMSGGLDSSSVAATAKAVLGTGASGRDLRAYTFVYDSIVEEEERRYSSLVADHLGIAIEHHPVDDYRWFERWNEGLLPPEPCTEPMTAMMADLFDRVARHAPVALTGDGGDPALLPSTLVSLIGQRPAVRLVADLWRSAWRTRTVPPIGIRSGVRRWLSPRGDARMPVWLSDAFVRRCDLRARSEMLSHRRATGDGARAAAAGAIVDPWWTSMFETYDPGATQRPVELRYPLFDVRYIAFALSLPTHPWCVNKEIARSAMRGRLPPAICTRPKSALAVDMLAAHGRWSVSDIAKTIAGAPQLADYVDVERFASAVRDDRVMTDEEPGTWSVVALATWLRCAAGSGVPA